MFGKPSESPAQNPFVHTKEQGEHSATEMRTIPIDVSDFAIAHQGLIEKKLNVLTALCDHVFSCFASKFGTLQRATFLATATAQEQSVSDPEYLSTLHLFIGLAYFSFSDNKMSDHYFQMAANAGNKLASCALAHAYVEYGDTEKVMTILAAIQSDTIYAKSLLAKIYFNKLDFKACRHFAEAAYAEGELCYGAYYLGVLTLNEATTTADYLKAYLYFKQAFDAGNTAAAAQIYSMIAAKQLPCGNEQLKEYARLNRDCAIYSTERTHGYIQSINTYLQASKYDALRTYYVWSCSTLSTRAEFINDANKMPLMWLYHFADNNRRITPVLTEPMRQAALVLIILKDSVTQLKNLSIANSVQTLFHPAITKQAKELIRAAEKDYFQVMELLKCPATLQEALTYELPPKDNVVFDTVLLRLMTALCNAQGYLSELKVTGNAAEILTASTDALKVIHPKIVVITSAELSPPPISSSCPLRSPPG